MAGRAIGPGVPTLFPSLNQRQRKRLRPLTALLVILLTSSAMAGPLVQGKGGPPSHANAGGKWSTPDDGSPDDSSDGGSTEGGSSGEGNSTDGSPGGDNHTSEPPTNDTTPDDGSSGDGPTTEPEPGTSPGVLDLTLTLRVPNHDPQHADAPARPVQGVRVELWDRGAESGEADRRLAIAWTDHAGVARFATSEADAVGGLDPFLVAWARVEDPATGGWRLRAARPDGATHTHRLDLATDHPWGAFTYDLTPAGADEAAPFHVVAVAEEARQRMASKLGLAVAATEFVWWPGHAPPCPTLPSCFLDPGWGAKRVHLNASGHQDAWDADVIVAGYGHRALFQLYWGAWPHQPWNGHGFPRAHDACTSPSEAWIAGWGVFLQAALKGAPRYRDAALGGGWRADQDLRMAQDGGEGLCRASSVAAGLWALGDPAGDGSLAGLGSVLQAAAKCRPANGAARIASAAELHGCWHSLALPGHDAAHAALARHGLDRARVGAWLSSITFSQLQVGALHDRLNRTGVEVVPFGAPLWRSDHLKVTRDFLERVGAQEVVLQVDTYKLSGLACCGPLDDAGRARIQQVFRDYAALAAQAPNVVLVVGANEPVHKTAWARNADMVERVTYEHQAWRATGSDLPFCHKFDYLDRPRYNDAGQPIGGAAVMRQLWDTAQDAVCYDWYRASGDTETTLIALRAEADARGMAVHILESTLWDFGNDPALLLRFARIVHTGRGDTFSLYPLFMDCKNDDCSWESVTSATHGADWQDIRRRLNMSAWWHRPLADTWELRPTGTMMRAVLLTPAEREARP